MTNTLAALIAWVMLVDLFVARRVSWSVVPFHRGGWWCPARVVSFAFLTAYAVLACTIGFVFAGTSR